MNKLYKTIYSNSAVNAGIFNYQNEFNRLVKYYFVNEINNKETIHINEINKFKDHFELNSIPKVEITEYDMLMKSKHPRFYRYLKNETNQFIFIQNYITYRHINNTPVNGLSIKGENSIIFNINDFILIYKLKL